MTRKEAEDNLHRAIVSTFKKPKRGYCWVKSHFGIFNTPNYMISLETFARMAACVASKRDGVVCPVHSRIHGA